MPTELPLWLERLLGYVRVDFAPRHRQPSAVSVVVATAVSIAGSLAADALLVMAGKKLFPTTQHYGHFQFSDYSKLTVIGVLIACVAWPIVTRISSDPRWLFFRQAVAVTLVLLLPDVYIWYQGQPIRAVGVLMVMHLAIGLVTYNALVHIAKAGQPEEAGGRDADRWADGQWDSRRAPAGRRPDYQDSWDYGGQEAYSAPSRQSYQDQYYRDAPGRQDYREPQDYRDAPGRQDYREPEAWDYGRPDARPAPSGRRENRGPWNPGQRDARSAPRSRRRSEADPWT